MRKAQVPSAGQREGGSDSLTTTNFVSLRKTVVRERTHVGALGGALQWRAGRDCWGVRVGRAGLSPPVSGGGDRPCWGLGLCLSLRGQRDVSPCEVSAGFFPFCLRVLRVSKVWEKPTPERTVCSLRAQPLTPVAARSRESSRLAQVAQHSEDSSGARRGLAWL